MDACPRNALLVGDCLDVLRTLPDNSVDSLVTDPPAGISFMGAEWDHDKGGRDSWVAWMSAILAECHRVLKPGGHALVWSLPRTSHWTAWALEEAGFEIRDAIDHIFFSGMPKSHNISKAIDRKAGAVREVIGKNPNARPKATKDNTLYRLGMVGKVGDITAPATPEAIPGDGFGTAIKPAHETWWLARKPLAQPIAANVLEFGTGALNIAACRIPFADEADEAETKGKNQHAKFGTQPGGNEVYGDYSMVPSRDYDAPGRWPANVVLTDPVLDDPENPWVIGGGPSSTTGHRRDPDQSSGGPLFGWDKKGRTEDTDQGKSRFFQLPVETDEYPRYLCIPKSSTRDRDAGVDGEPISLSEREVIFQTGNGTNGKASSVAGRDTRRSNTHPTAKSVALMTHLICLVTPPGGLVLDPFAGSGTTLVAAAREGFAYLGIEREAEYAAIIRARLGLSEPIEDAA